MAMANGKRRNQRHAHAPKQHTHTRDASKLGQSVRRTSPLHCISRIYHRIGGMCIGQFGLNISGVQPATAPEEGGTVVVVHGEGFPEFEPVRCKTGSVLGHAARWSSASSLECPSVSSRPGEARLNVALNGQLQSAGGSLLSVACGSSHAPKKSKYPADNWCKRTSVPVGQ